MKKYEYYLENNDLINELDLKNLRTFYLPFLGPEPVALYQYFVDQANFSKNSRNVFDFDEISMMLQMSDEKFLEAKKKLEAIGLLNTFESDFYKKVIFKLQKPLKAKMISQNKLILSELSKFLPIEKIEKLIEENTITKFNKEEYIETTARFYDVYKLDFKKMNNLDEISKPKTKSKDGNKFEVIQYFEELANRKAAPSIKKEINYLLEKGFCDLAIKHFIDFSLKVNKGEINIKYVVKVANSYLKNNVINPEDVLDELNESWLQRNKSKTLFNNKNYQDDEQNDYFKLLNIEDKNENKIDVFNHIERQTSEKQISTVEDRSFDEIFNELVK